MYAETDFFLALLKEEDWLKKRAEQIYREHKDEMWTHTLTELMLLAHREGWDALELVEKASSLVEVREPRIGVEGYLSACYVMKKYAATPFDALHAVYCGGDEIISSDRKYDRIGLKRIRLEED
jgi:predicted nucleic acid-binding protein